MKECFSLIGQQWDLFDKPNRVEEIKKYLETHREPLCDGPEGHLFDLPKEERVELMRFYVHMFGNVFILDRWRYRWDALSEEEKRAICN